MGVAGPFLNDTPAGREVNFRFAERFVSDYREAPG